MFVEVMLMILGIYQACPPALIDSAFAHAVNSLNVMVSGAVEMAVVTVLTR